MIVAAILIIITEIALLCCKGLARKVPVNYLLLLLFTCCEAYLVSAICSAYSLSQPEIIIAAGAGTAMITLACTAYAFTTKTDFTIMGGLMWVLMMTVLILTIATWVLRWNTFLYNFIIAICIFIFGIFLIFDTQLIVCKGRHKLSLDDYIIGAMIIYLDIITIFLYLLELLAKR